MDEKPFNDVYFTGMVRDKQGRKMSKSLNNSPDLLQMIERTGADAVRFGIMISSPAGNDLLFDDTSPDQGRNFNNKIWNALKLVKMWEERTQDSSHTDHFPVTWFENRLNEARADIEKLLTNFKISEALKTIYSLIWDDFCSWYLEWIKPGFEQPIDKKIYESTVNFFERLMQLLHPFMPFITEEVYHLLQDRSDDLCVKQFEAVKTLSVDVLEKGQLLKDVITGLRDARNKQQLKPRDEIKLHIQASDKTMYDAIKNILSKQVNATELNFVNNPVPNAIAVVIGKDKFFIESPQAADTGNQKDELVKELQYLQGFLVSVNKKLTNERFMQNAKQDIIDLEQKKKADAEAKIKVIEESLANM
jgi:valyl-tRNA synthetase